jgi:LuxR family quorum-sensing system transcriptional regulator CciR
MTDYAAGPYVPALPIPANENDPPRPVRAVLTPRQRQCLAWVEQGKSSTDIGAILGLSPETVNEHVGEACRRLNVRTRVQAVVVARARGLMSGEVPGV